MITIPESYALYIDFAVIAFYIVLMIIGVRRGFLVTLVNVLAVLGSLFIAWRLYPVMASHFSLWPHSWMPVQAGTLYGDGIYGYVNELIWFLVLFAIMRIVFLLLEPVARALQKIPVLKQISELLGGVCGIIGATLWVLVICLILNTPLFANGSAMVQATYLSAISEKTADVFSFLKQPLADSNAFAKLYNDVTSLSDEDRSTVSQWLDQHGYQATAEPAASTEPSAGSEPAASAESSAGTKPEASASAKAGGQ